MLSKEHRLNYEKELKIVLGTVCDGFRQEVRYRQLKILQLPTEKENFDLSYEHERAIVSILAFYIRTAGFLVRPEHYWCDNDEKLKGKTPDLAIWLPRTMTDFFLEVKRIDSPVKNVSSDLYRLSKAQTSNKYNGLLVFGFAKTKDEHEKLRENYQTISEKMSESFGNKFDNVGLRPVSFMDIDGAELKSAMVDLWYRRV